ISQQSLYRSHTVLTPLSSLLMRPPARSTPFPYTTLFRSQLRDQRVDLYVHVRGILGRARDDERRARLVDQDAVDLVDDRVVERPDRKSTRLNSSHVKISYAVFCLKKKKKIIKKRTISRAH